MRVLHILEWEGTDAKKSGTFFKVVVQSVLLFVSDMWVAPPPTPADTGDIPQSGLPYDYYQVTMA